MSGFPLVIFSPGSLVKYDLLHLYRDTWFTLWQVKMWAILTKDEVDDALNKFGKKYSKT